MTAIETHHGPLDERRLQEVAALYGSVDAKYRSGDYLRHLFVENPFGWALHAFARDDGQAVGHCAVVPLRARAGTRPLTSGKVEAFFVDERYRGRAIAQRLLEAVCTAAGEHGVDPLHAYVTPRVGAVFLRAGFTCTSTGFRPHVLATRGGGAAARAQNGLAAAVGGTARTVGRSWTPVVEAANGSDAALVASIPEPEAWTIAADESWDWFLASRAFDAVEVEGRLASRTLVYEDGDSLHVVAWRRRGGGTGPALGALDAVRREARRRGVRTLRVQPWRASGYDPALTRACRLLGFVPRAPLTLHVRAQDETLGRVAPSPFFYLTF